MALFGDFSSLFEVGLGIGIGLSLFRIPIDNRKSHLVNRVENELKLFSTPKNDEATARYERAASLALELDAAIMELEKRVKHFPVVALVGALMNAVMIFVVAFNAGKSADIGHIWFFGFVAFGWYLILTLIIFGIVEKAFSGIEVRLERT